MLAGVVALGIPLLYAAVNLSANDWIAIFGGMAVLVSCSAMLDFAGRKEAQRKPRSDYDPLHLPGHRSPLKPILTVATLLALIAWAILTANPLDTSYGSPMPYLLAAGFIFFVMPQLLARVEMRRASRSGRGSQPA